jgi:hypothetical protein
MLPEDGTKLPFRQTKTIKKSIRRIHKIDLCFCRLRVQLLTTRPALRGIGEEE